MTARARWVEIRENGTGTHSSRVSWPARASSALRRSMKAVVFGPPVFNGDTSGSVVKKAMTARPAAAERTSRTPRASRIFRRGAFSGASEATSNFSTRPDPETSNPGPRTLSSSGFLGPRLMERPAELPDAFLRLLARQCQRGAEPYGGSAGGERDQTVLQTGREHAVPHGLVRKIEREEEAPAPHVRNDSRELRLQLRKPREQVLADGARVAREVFLFDDLQVSRAPDHVHEVSAPGRIDARGDLEDVVHAVDAAVRREAADLRLLAEDEEVRLDAELLPAPHREGLNDAGMHLVENEEELELVGERAQAPEELRPEVVVAPFPLDRLEDERGDVAGRFGAGLADLA